MAQTLDSAEMPLSSLIFDANPGYGRMHRAHVCWWWTVILAAFLLVCNPSYPTDRNDVADHIHEIDMLLGAGKLSEAMLLAKQAISKDVDDSSHNRSFIEYLMAEMSFWHGETDDGKHQLEAAIADSHRQHGRDTTRVLYELRLLDADATDIQRLASIVGIDREQQTLIGKAPPELADDQRNLTNTVRQILARINNAEKSAREGEDGAIGAHAYASALRAEIQMLLGQNNEAERLLRSMPAEGANLKSGDVYGVLERNMVKTELARESRQWPEAISLGEASLQLSSTRFGDCHPLTLTILERLSAAVAGAGDDDRALAISADWLARLRKVTDAEFVRITLLSAAQSYTMLPRQDLAKTALESYIRMVIEDDHPDVARTKAELASLSTSFPEPSDVLNSALLQVRDVETRSQTPLNEGISEVFDNFVAAALDDVGRPEEAQAIRRELARVHPSESISASATEVLSRLASVPTTKDVIDELVSSAKKSVRDEKDFNSSLALYKSAYERARRIFPIVTTPVVERLIDVARTLVALGLRQDALTFCELYVNRVSDATHADAESAAASLQKLGQYYDEIGELALAEDARRKANNRNSEPEQSSDESQAEAYLELPDDRVVATLMVSESASVLKGSTADPFEWVASGMKQIADGAGAASIPFLSAALLRLNGLPADARTRVAVAEANRGLALAYRLRKRPDVSAYFFLRYLQGVASAQPANLTEVISVVSQLSELSWTVHLGSPVWDALTKLAGDEPTIAIKPQGLECDILVAMTGMRGPTDAAIAVATHEAATLEAEFKMKLQSDRDSALVAGLCAVRIDRAIGADRSANQLIDRLAPEIARRLPTNSPELNPIQSMIEAVGWTREQARRCDEEFRKAKKQGTSPSERFTAWDVGAAECFRAGVYDRAVEMDIEAAHLQNQQLHGDAPVPKDAVLSLLEERARKYRLCAMDRSPGNHFLVAPAGCAVAHHAIRRAAVMLALDDARPPMPVLRHADSPELRSEGPVRQLMAKLLEADSLIGDLPIPERAGLFWESLVVAEATRDEESTRAIEALAERIDPGGAANKNFVQHLDRTRDAIQHLRQEFQPNEMVLAYYRAGGQYYTWAITDSGIRFCRLRVDPYTLRADIRAILGAVDPSSGGYDTEENPVPVGTAWRIYQRIIGDVISPFELKPTTYVVPDDQLRSVPFAALVTREPEANEWTSQKDWQPHWLVLSTAIVVEPDLQAYWVLKSLVAQKPHAPKPFVGFGSPTTRVAPLRVSTRVERPAGLSYDDLVQMGELPGAADELGRMALILGAPASDVKVGPQMTKSTIRDMSLQDYRVIAFATHGKLRDRLDPSSDAALLLSADGADDVSDRLLTAHEIASLRLQAQTVILSACNTAAAESPIDEDNLGGLPAAFLYAGAQSVLVTLWPVISSDAPVLTNDFLEHTAKGVRSAESLQWAQQQSAVGARGREMRHPATWAAFSLIGLPSLFVSTQIH